MALAQAALKAELLKLFDPDHPQFVGYPGDAATMADNWKAAFDAYGAAAANSGGAAVTLKSPSGFKGALQGAIPAPDSATPATGAAAFQAAFTAYWTGGMFANAPPPPSGVGGTGVFASVITSVVSAVAPALTPLLAAQFAINSDDPDARADAIATAFHMAKTSVTVISTGLDTTPTPAGPLPIVNTAPIQ